MLDPQSVHISNHTKQRYAERRGWQATIARGGGQLAELTIRDLLLRVADQNPAVFVHPQHGPSRRYVCGQLAWVVSVDNRTVITFYELASTSKQKAKAVRKAMKDHCPIERIKRRKDPQ